MNNFNQDESINNIKLLRKIKEDNGFNSVWSTGLKAENINDAFPEEISELNYDGMVETVNKENEKYVTYLDLWKAADKLISKSEDYWHIFIEDFEKDYNGDFHLLTGS